MKVILLGAPGSGKGTQAELLQERLGLPHISTGEMLRDAVSEGTELGKKAEPIMEAGGLISDDLMNGIVAERLSRDDVSQGFVLDGYPRTVDQAKSLERIDGGNGPGDLRVIQLSVPDDVIVSRVAARLSCPKCGAIYHRENCPPKEEGKCDRCGSALVTRADDREGASVRKRLDEYHRATVPVVEFYRDKGMLHEIDGLGDVELIFEQIRKFLN